MAAADALCLQSVAVVFFFNNFVQSLKGISRVALLGSGHLDKVVEFGDWGTVAELDELGEQLVTFGQRDALVLNIEQKDANSTRRGDTVSLCLTTGIEIVADKQAILVMGSGNAGAFTGAQTLT